MSNRRTEQALRPSTFNISGVSHASFGSEPRSAVFSVETIVRQRLPIEFSPETG
jgi:hypothetical protein